MITNRTALRSAAVAGFLAVALGAFGAHGLEKILVDNKTVEVWQTAVLYHFIHAIMLFALGTRVSLHTGAWLSFLIGIVVFSGSLYLLAVTNLKWLGAITPLGGVSFLVGWFWLILCPLKTSEANLK